MVPQRDSNDPYEQFQVGDHVKHPDFGEGQILHRTGSGDDTKLVVSFAEEGEKRLMARYANLKKSRSIKAEDPEEEIEEDEDEEVLAEDEDLADEEGFDDEEE